MIEISRLSVRYGTVEVLTDLSVSFPKASFTCVIGPNGCGKTTLMKTLAGVIPFSKGNVRINGEDMLSMSGIERAKKLASLPQSRPVPDMAVLTMIQHGRFPHMGFGRRLSPNDHRHVEEAIELTGTGRFLERPVAALSGGERQRVYIAMAVAQGADTLLLDEPATGLDLRYQIEFMQTVDKLHKQGKTIIVVTHDLPLAFSYAERICLLNDGRLLGCAEPEDKVLRAHLPHVFGYSLQKTKRSGRELFKYQIVKGV